MSNSTVETAVLKGLVLTPSSDEHDHIDEDKEMH